MYIFSGVHPLLPALCNTATSSAPSTVFLSLYSDVIDSSLSSSKYTNQSDAEVYIKDGVRNKGHPTVSVALSASSNQKGTFQK
jgi:hypothetical protein